MTKSVITIATGKKYFLDLACNLIRSFLLWNEKTDIAFWLVTDRKELIPGNLEGKIKILEIQENEYGTGFEPKLFLDHFAQTEQTLFIDADCLIYGNLIPVFEKFKGCSVSAIGDNITEGDFYCNVKETIQKLEVSFMPRFVGGVYYLEPSEVTQKVFEYARHLKPRYDELGLIRLRGKENEEPLIALGMAKYEFNAIPEDGSIKADRMFFRYIKSNVLAGKAHFWNNKDYPHKAYFKIDFSFPVIGHFNNTFSENYEYASEERRLYLNEKGWNYFFIESYVWLFILAPGKLKERVKNIFRPFFHAIFSPRKLKQSKRL